jgi:hypothetical protein
MPSLFLSFPHVDKDNIKYRMYLYTLPKLKPTGINSRMGSKGSKETALISVLTPFLHIPCQLQTVRWTESWVRSGLVGGRFPYTQEKELTCSFTSWYPRPAPSPPGDPHPV